jgi:hypothetical protein
LVYFWPMVKAKEEKYKVKGEDLLAKIKDLVKEGNIRRITISDKKGKELVTFPLTLGVIGAVIAPVLAAVGAIAALVTECTLTVERKN